MLEDPLLILDADHKPVEENIKQLSDILQSDEYRDLPVKVVSVAGKIRCGKSTTMNLFMKQLRAHETTRQPIGELGASLNGDTELDGFLRDNGRKSVTHGVYIWPRPFIVSGENGYESAVLLMDVEGAFDGTTIVESTPVFVFAALVSSAVLLNVVGVIDELVIQLLDHFVATGNAKLQGVTIVVRDDSLGQTFGFEPGNELLKEKMEVTDSMDEAMRTARERICQFAPNLSCILLPHPGQQAAEQNDWTNVRPEFLSCTSDLLCAAIRDPKLVEERPLKCFDFVAFMEAMRESTNLRVFQEAENGYRRDIRALASEMGLEKAHEQLQREAIEHLQHVQPPKVREQLTIELKAKLEKIKSATNEDMRRGAGRKFGIGAIAASAVALVAVVPAVIIGAPVIAAAVPAAGAVIPATAIVAPAAAAIAPVIAAVTPVLAAVVPATVGVTLVAVGAAVVIGGVVVGAAVAIGTATVAVRALMRWKDKAYECKQEEETRRVSNEVGAAAGVGVKTQESKGKQEEETRQVSKQSDAELSAAQRNYPSSRDSWRSWVQDEGERMDTSEVPLIPHDAHCHGQ